MDSISVFEMIKIGIGPSSSHTMGPWRAAELFLTKIVDELGDLKKVGRIQGILYGSLAKTGKGHGTDIAILMGLSGEDYTTIDTTLITQKVDSIKNTRRINLNGKSEIPFDPDTDLVFDYSKTLPFHPNGMLFKATLLDGRTIEEKYYSLGGGFVSTEHETISAKKKIVTPYPCHHAVTILENCEKLKIRVSDLILINEQAWRSEAEIKSAALKIWHEIKDCIYRGVHRDGILPGGLEVQRRAAEFNRKLLGAQTYTNRDEWIDCVKRTEPTFDNINKWVSCFALAVNEENAAFGRIVTAPTNGAAGVIPAVLMYAYCFTKKFDEDKVVRFILTAGEIATIFKKNATISAAMGGCQAEIGVSSSMAAGALVECLGGTPSQVMMAAEIAMEHHLGMTCDPVRGLVQIPCIERNTMGAIKAITASNLALEGDPDSAKVSLDDVIKTMWETAKAMKSDYKETSEGGLAVNISVNVTEC
jgi:L-serine dehydratase